MTVENDLDKAQEDLASVTSKLEEKEKKVQEVKLPLEGHRMSFSRQH